MSLARFWASFKTLYLSKPREDRPLFRELREAIQERTPLVKILEVGVGNGDRSERIVHWLRENGACDPQRYAAIDAFELGGPGHISLKDYHRRLSKLGGEIKPFPVPITGNLSIALTRVAHTLGGVDCMILDIEPSAWGDPQSTAMLRRLIHPQTLVLGKPTAGGRFVKMAIPGSAPATKIAA